MPKPELKHGDLVFGCFVVTAIEIIIHGNNGLAHVCMREKDSLLAATVRIVHGVEFLPKSVVGIFVVVTVLLLLGVVARLCCNAATYST
jgi:hypothetical protein